ncbi:M23 family metallopeptidase [Clostridiisalibacter paucivorans]|uniref:M23 family metallopeptidase n=1 Tax=Clostridiisalibacter paucivorans TaxID=408753 RepID=UPI0006856090|nr:M23 family metallopeptidase [Clostridiisalibacter paucivorans]
MMFLVISGGDDSTEQDVLIIHTAKEDMIDAALRCEKKFGGNWIKHLTSYLVSIDFQFDEFSSSEMVDFAELYEKLGREEVLGKTKYKTYKDIKKYYYMIYDDLAEIEEDEEGKEIIEYHGYYPIPRGYDYIHNDDFGAGRTFGGDRHHKGNDIMAKRGTPLVAVTSGIVERIGWERLGGWRIGIRDSNNRYWYYAHMEEYERGIDRGDRIKAGDIIGYMGDSGYGPEGTTGKFATHLHIQIGVEFPGEKEIAYINPYGILKFLEKNKITLEEEEEDK